MGDRLVRKGFVVGIILLFIGSNFVSGLNIQLKNTTYPLVIGSGNTLYVGGSGPNNYTRIQDAINDSVDGDTVFVYDDSSPYYEKVEVDKSINLIGEDKDTTIIIVEYFFGVIYIVVDWVNISGFTIQSVGNPYMGIGIQISSNHNTITDNNIISNNNSGIYLELCSNNIITGNNISNNLNGIDLWSNSNTISGNKISNNMCGIDLYDSNDNTITDNNISNNMYGISFDDSNDNIITANNIMNGEYGILGSGNSNIITGNNITNNWYGIYLVESSSNIITSNNITNNGDGISLVDSSSNRILKNNFIGNVRDAFFSNYRYFLPLRNRWDQNYWERPRILPKPIFGEIYWLWGPYL
jgi:parallel beta-helix repeat protein